MVKLGCLKNTHNTYIRFIARNKLGCGITQYKTNWIKMFVTTYAVGTPRDNSMCII